MQSKCQHHQSSTLPPSSSPFPSHSFSAFQLSFLSDISECTRKSKFSTSRLDLLPTVLVKTCLHTLLPLYLLHLRHRDYYPTILLFLLSSKTLPTTFTNLCLISNLASLKRVATQLHYSLTNNYSLKTTPIWFLSPL